MQTKALRSKLDQLKGQRIQLEETLKTTRISLRKNTNSLRRHEKAQQIINVVALKTQKKLQYHISDLTSLALDAVIPDPYKLVVDFVERRNKTECDLYFERDGHAVDPIKDSGVGAVDVAAFALRIACWSMARPRSRATIILDEPFKHLSEDLQEQASLMVKEISQKLKIQFIIVTHVDALAAHADKVFNVKMYNKVSKVS